MEDNEKPLAYSRDALEFATVAVQYCAFLETVTEQTRDKATDILLKLLPLLYLKGSMLPDIDESELGDFDEPQGITEENYEIVRNNAAYVMAEKDTYLDVFVEGMRYSDTPVIATISENLADIYQHVKNFAILYKDGTDEAMTYAIYAAKYEFRHSWGQCAANVMRALHDARYGDTEDDI